jgi:DNA-binding CsgD family transcriptional regulator
MDPLPKAAEPLLAEAIARIGTDRFAPALWDFLHALARPDSLVILAFRDAGPPAALYRRFEDQRVFAGLERAYLAGAYRLDPFYEMHLNRAGEGAYRLRDVAPDAFHRSRYFIEYYEGTTLVDEIAFLVWPSPGVSLNLSLGRDGASGRTYSGVEIATCRRLAPVVAAMTRMHWRDLGAGAGAVEDTPALLAAAARDRLGIALSPRQAEVALLILRGHSSMSIGLRLGLSPQTIKVFRKQLYRRCAISSQAELFARMLPLLNDGGQNPGASPLGRGSTGIDPVAR